MKFAKKTFVVKVKAPINIVFDGICNPEFTPLWALGIKKEIATELPPKLGTIYSSVSHDSDVPFELIVDELKAPNILGMSSGTFHEIYKLQSIFDGRATLLNFTKWYDDKDANYDGQQERLLKLAKIIEDNYKTKR